MLYPEYQPPIKLITALALSAIINKRRSFVRDSRLALKGVTPPVRYIGLENLPKQGPFLMLMNHYSRPGFMVLWGALALSACLPGEPLWMMTRAWTSLGSWWDKPKRFITSTIFKRQAQVYGFITTPPMPPEPQDALERAISVRNLLHAVRANPNSIVALAPEGRDIPGGVLGNPPPGSGKLIGQLAGILHTCIAVGVYEEQGRLCVSFGEAFELPVKLDARDDIKVSDFIMRKIAVQLPANMRADLG